MDLVCGVVVIQREIYYDKAQIVVRRDDETYAVERAICPHGIR